MAQYEMGLREYWRILRKRKLAIVLICIGSGILTFILTQHVFKAPPRFKATCEISVRAAEVVGERSPMTPPKVAQQAKVARSEMLIGETVWAIEHYPVYIKKAFRGAVFADETNAERRAMRTAILEALAKLEGVRDEEGAERAVRRVAEIRDLTCLFSDPSGDASARRILDQDRRRNDTLGAGDTKALPEFISDERNQADRELLETVIGAFQAGVVGKETDEVDYDWNADTMTLAVVTTGPDSDPERGRTAASRLTETLATVYEAYTEWEGSRAVSDQLARIKGEIEDLQAERDVLDAELRKAQTDLEAETAGGEYEEARAAARAAADQVNSLRIYHAQLGRYLEQRGEIKASPDAKKTYPPIPSPAGIDDANIRALYAESTKFETEKNEKLEFHKPDSHVITALDEKIGRTAAQLRQVVAGAITNEESRAELARTRLEKAEAELPLELRADVESLKLEIDNKNASIIALNDRAGQLALFKDQGIKIDIIGRPGTAEELEHASPFAKTAVGAIIGLILGVVLAVLWETLDLTMGTIEEVESFLGTRVLGVIPHVEADRIAAEIRARQPDAEAETGEAELQQRATLVTLYDPKAVPAEAFRHVRTSLEFARVQADSDAKVFLITSATLYEGKTTVAANLAVVMAQNGKRTCLVECDLRRPQLHHLFGIDRSPGLHDVFIGKTGWADAKKSLSDLLLGKIGMDTAVGAPGLEDLSIITCGVVPPNPVELLDSDETRAVFSELRDAFDIVIVDSPPILPVADAAVISPLVDGAILVYRAGAAPRTMLGRAKTELEAAGTSLLGVVLNDLRPTSEDVSSTYYRGYPRKPYAAAEEPPAPRVPVALAEEAAADRAAQTAEEQALRKADLCLLQGHVEQAVEAAYEAARAMPESMSVRLGLARAYAAAGRIGEAQAELLAVLEMDPRNLEALERLADMAADAGLEREALQWSEEILEFDPDNARARERADELRARLGDAGPETV